MTRKRKPVDPPPAGTLALHLLNISKAIRAYAGLKLQEIGLYPGQDEILMALSGNEKLGITALARTIRVRPSTVSKSIDKLEASGLVERLGGDADLRASLISMTAEGLEMKKRVEEVWKIAEQEIFGKIGVETIAAIAEDVDKIDVALTGLMLKARGQTPTASKASLRPDASEPFRAASARRRRPSGASR